VSAVKRDQGSPSRVIAIDPPTPEAARLWNKLTELARKFGPHRHWCLIGGLMVQLHAYEHDAPLRATEDIDILGDARRSPSVTEQLARQLEAIGATMSLPPTTEPRLGYQFKVDGETIELLAPEGLRNKPKTLGHYETIQVDGGTQALQRTERVGVSVAGCDPVTVRRPTLLGAILIKAKALARAREKENHREDLIRLLSFVHDPRALAESQRLRGSESRWLSDVENDLNFADSLLAAAFSETQLIRAQQAFELLASVANRR
jgi:hypothetical protein